MFRGSLKKNSLGKHDKSQYSKFREEGERMFIRLMEGNATKKDFRHKSSMKQRDRRSTTTVGRFRPDGFALPKVMHASAGTIVGREEQEREKRLKGSEFKLTNDGMRKSMDNRYNRYTEDGNNPRNRVKFSRNMMKGIRLKKFNELKIRLNDRNGLGFGKKRKESVSENAAIKEIDDRRNKQLFILKQRISNTRRNLASFKRSRHESSTAATKTQNYRSGSKNIHEKGQNSIISKKKNKFEDKYHSQEPKKSRKNESRRILTPNSKFLDNLSCFEVKDRLGKGAYARVHLVRHKETKKYYALKTYPKDYLTKPHRIANIRNEVGLLFEVSHPNIINLHHVCETKDNIHLVMNRGGRKSLDKYLETRPGHRVSEKEAAIMLKQMAESLLFLHKKGIAHRDIKLGNVLIGDNFKCVLIDFGFATRCGNSKLTTFCGTPCYMCPEILLKKPYYGQQADTWALGVLLYRLVCGTQPFKGKGKDLRKSITLGHFTIPQNLSTPLRGLLREMMHMNTSERATMSQVLNSLWIMKVAP